MLEVHQVVAKKEATVSEVFCQDRFTSRCREFGLQPGYALDLTTGWDLDDPEQMQKAEELQTTYEPQVLIGSPSCRAHSQLLKFNVMDEEKRRRWREASLVHLRACCRMYKRQVESGRIFLHEHPHAADSWKKKFKQGRAKSSGSQKQEANKKRTATTK